MIGVFKTFEKCEKGGLVLLRENEIRISQKERKIEKRVVHSKQDSFIKPIKLINGVEYFKRTEDSFWEGEIKDIYVHKADQQANGVIISLSSLDFGLDIGDKIPANCNVKVKLFEEGESICDFCKKDCSKNLKGKSCPSFNFKRNNNNKKK
jgi:hypothetical protein